MSTTTPDGQLSPTIQDTDARGYIGLYRQNILIVRAVRQDSNVPLPQYLQPMLGGMSNLRGFRAGSFIGAVGPGKEAPNDYFGRAAMQRKEHEQTAVGAARVE